MVIWRPPNNQITENFFVIPCVYSQENRLFISALTLIK